ncbi:MAG: septum formation initiator family protein [Pseudobdellovibrio sp.]
MLTLFLNGTLWKLWGLYRDQKTIIEQTSHAQAQIVSLDMQLKQAKDPAFIERQARDKMDLVGDHDLIFVFPE